jgi:hypothetical protein
MFHPQDATHRWRQFATVAVSVFVDATRAGPTSPPFPCLASQIDVAANTRQRRQQGDRAPRADDEASGQALQSETGPAPGLPWRPGISAVHSWRRVPTSLGASHAASSIAHLISPGKSERTSKQGPSWRSLFGQKAQGVRLVTGWQHPSRVRSYTGWRVTSRPRPCARGRTEFRRQRGETEVPARTLP